jgi:pyruvate/2-oxoglutarate/acetoin dehydrogenase E1 component
MFMDFITLAVDQLVNMAAKLKPIYGLDCPLVIRAPQGGGRGYGATHSQSLERLFMGIPGILIAAPSNAADVSALLQTALRGKSPVLFLEHKMLYPQRFDDAEPLPGPIPFGVANAVRTGKDVTIIAWSYMTQLAIQASDHLKESGIEAEVIDLLTLKPLDMGMIVESLKQTGRAIIVEEGPKTGGVGAEIAAQIMEHAYDYLERPLLRLASPDLPIPSAKNLEAACIPSAETIQQAVRQLLA